MKKRYPAPVLWTLGILVGGLLLWEWAAATGRINPFFFSSPGQVWRDFCAIVQSGLLARHLGITAQEAGLGILLGGVAGSLTGVALGTHERVSQGVMPLMTGLNGLPKLALGPLIIIWFGIGIASKVFISGLMVYFIFVFNLYAGVRSVDASLVGAVKLLGGTRQQILGKVIWPSCLPWFFTSLRTGLGLGLSGAIVGEYLGAARGLGWMISNAGERYDITRVLSCVLVVIVLMALLDGMVRLLERRLLRWR